MLALAAFACSGASALIFETVAHRRLVLVLGASAPATTAILMGFFAGIAAGSQLGGRLLRRIGQPLRFYVCVELCIGAAILATPLLLAGIDSLYLDIVADSYALKGVPFGLRLVMAAAAVLPATIGMGATIPAMNRILVESGNGVGRGVSLAYGLNTVGSVIGCLATGFILIRWLGMTGSLYAAVGLNGTAALLMLGAPRLSPLLVAGIRTDGPGAASMTSGRRYGLLAIYFGAGALSLGYETLWLRLLGIYGTNSIVTFTLGLATFLLGIGAGSLLLYPLLRRWLGPPQLFLWSNLGVVAGTLASLPAIYRLPDVIWQYLMPRAVTDTLTEFAFVGVEVLASGATVFIPTVFMGLAYPALCDLLIGGSRGEVEVRSGRYYTIGTLGAALGAGLVGLVVIPSCGLVGTLGVLLVASLTLCFGTLALVVSHPRKMRWAYGLLLATLTGPAVLYGVTGKPHFALGRLQATGEGRWRIVPELPDQQRYLLSYRAGPTGTVMVEDRYFRDGREPKRTLLVDGQPVAATDTANRADAKLIGHLPLLLHPGPRSALTVGFGSGGTSWSMSLHDVDVECVEIEPEVPRAAHWFRQQNRNVLDHPRYRLVINDARDHLRLSTRRYDVISTDVTNIQYKQNSNLYTREYFQLLRSRLAEGGVACVWAPIGGLEERDFRILLHTFRSVFPHAAVWYVHNTQSGYVIFTAQREAFAVDLERWEKAFANPAIAADLADVGVDNADQLMSFLLLDPAGVGEYLGSLPLHTDDHPILEFSSAYSAAGGGRFIAGTLLNMLVQPSPDLAALLAHASAAQRRGLESHARGGRLWTEVVARSIADRFLPDGPEALGNLERALEVGREALAVAPELHPVGGRLLPHLERQRDVRTAAVYLAGRLRGDAVAAVPRATGPPANPYRETFDAARGGLPYYPHLGGYRPEDTQLRSLARWVAAAQGMAREAGVRPHLGREETGGLVVRGVAGTRFTAFFTPLRVQPETSYCVTYWRSDDGLGSESGVGVIQYDAPVGMGGQLPQSVDQPHRLAVDKHSPDVGVKGEWGEYEFCFTTRPECRMIHLLFFVDGAPPAGTVVFDDIELRQGP